MSRQFGMGGGFGSFLPEWDPRSWAARLTVIVGGLFVLLLVGNQVPFIGQLIQHGFSYSPGEVMKGEVWQLLTYILLEAGPLRGYFSTLPLELTTKSRRIPSLINSTR